MKNVVLATLLGLAALSAHADFVSADDAAEALARGARVVDVRSAAAYGAGHLPGAVLVEATVAMADRASLQALVSRQGVDLSREVVVVGQAGDVLAQQLHAHLKAYATGRVSWLVGGGDRMDLNRPCIDHRRRGFACGTPVFGALARTGLCPAHGGCGIARHSPFQPRVHR